METKMTGKTFPLKQVQKWVQTWQENNKTRAKAYRIPVSDLIGCFLEMGVISLKSDGTMVVNDIPDACVRAYLGTNPDPSKRTMAEGFGNKLYIVGTEKIAGKYRDIVQDEGIAEPSAAITGSGIYDITTPCPNDCDDLSPLVNP
ncbi:hypothetical protein SAMN04487989_101330 [Bizionia echini]|uniref:Uncharacterized protein n=1 Tax=Bizionia echini TaxID=649333 RepID=A0A1I4YW22_9FLAO|nr:hypothetical protein [Bizionia echini]SFN42214.1 hypothetical protein SAMN04487989_101330 [Bizionia echini]